MGVCYVRTTALCSLVIQELLAPELDSYILNSYIRQEREMHFSVRCGFLQSEHIQYLLLQSLLYVIYFAQKKLQVKLIKVLSKQTTGQ